MKKAKNIFLSERCIEVLTIRAAKSKMVFKTYVEKLLEDIAKNKSNGK